MADKKIKKLGEVAYILEMHNYLIAINKCSITFPMSYCKYIQSYRVGNAQMVDYAKPVDII